MTELTDEQKRVAAAVADVGKSGGAGLMAGLGSPWAVVIFKPGQMWAYPAESREKAESAAADLAQSSVEAIKIGVFEARAWAVVQTSVRFSGMGGDMETTPVDRPPPAG